MKHIDEIRGFERTILLGDQPGHTTQGNTAITNCVVEVVELDAFGRCPVLSLRFYDKPLYGHKTATESAERGHPLCDADTPIGVEIDLGPDLAQSLFEQIKVKWPQYIETLKSQLDSEEGAAG